MTRSLADPLVLDGHHLAWRLPTVLPPLPDAKKAIQLLEQQTVPADIDHVKGCLKYMAYATAHKDATQDDWKYRTRVYMHALAGVPRDIWSATAKELAITSEWWPPVAKLAKIMLPKVEQRQRQLERARKIVEAHGIKRPTATPSAPVKPVTPRGRILDMLVIWRKHRRDDKVEDYQRQLVRMRYGAPKPQPRPKVDLMAKVGAQLSRQMTPEEQQRAEALRADTLRDLGEEAGA